jgi:hypothetical protein
LSTSSSTKPVFLTEQELADRWNIAFKYLQNLRHQGKVPKYFQRSKGAECLYFLDEVEKFELSRSG